MKHKEFLKDPRYVWYREQLRLRDKRGGERLVKRLCKDRGEDYKEFKENLAKNREEVKPAPKPTRKRKAPKCVRNLV